MATHLYFQSNAAAPYYKLSNFFATKIVFKASDVVSEMEEICPQIKLWLGPQGQTFPSSEHLWQALKAKDLETFLAFVEEGRFTNMLKFFQDFFMNIAASSNKQWFVMVAKKCTYWGAKNMIGILAKMAANPKYARKLELAPDKMNYAAETLTADKEAAVWKPILRAKFAQNEELRTILRETGRLQLVEFDKGASRNLTHWGGLWKQDEARVIGENVMGRYVSIARDELDDDD